MGDAAFQEKCQKRMKELLNGGTTLLFVSHTTKLVRKMCDHAIWINKGKQIMTGLVDEVCDAYLHSLNLTETGND